MKTSSLTLRRQQTFSHHFPLEILDFGHECFVVSEFSMVNKYEVNHIHCACLSTEFYSWMDEHHVLRLRNDVISHSSSSTIFSLCLEKPLFFVHCMIMLEDVLLKKLQRFFFVVIVFWILATLANFIILPHCHVTTLPHCHIVYRFLEERNNNHGDTMTPAI